MSLRSVGDYGAEVRIDANQAAQSVASARRILDAVGSALPAHFPPVPVRSSDGNEIS